MPPTFSRMRIFSMLDRVGLCPWLPTFSQLRAYLTAVDSVAVSDLEALEAVRRRLRRERGPCESTGEYPFGSRIQELNERAEVEYTRVVEDIIRSRCRDVRLIEHTLDGLLDFCGHDPVLKLYRRLCRHYWDIDPVATAAYVRFHREMWGLAEAFMCRFCGRCWLSARKRRSCGHRTV